MSTPYRRLRRQMPYLTPTWAGDDDQPPRRPLQPIVPPAPEPPEFEEPYQSGRRLTLPNVVEDALSVLGSNPIDIPREAIRRFDAYVPLGGYDINQPVPREWPMEPESAKTLRRTRAINQEREIRQEIRRPHLGGRVSGPANYRSAPDNAPALVMPKPTNGGYEERVIEPTTGAVLGFGDERDYAPLSRTAPPVVTAPTRISDEQLAEIGAPPMVVRRDGRPTTKFIGEGTPEERLLTRRRALEEYQPQKESKKSLALRTILNFVGGGIPGAVGTLIGPAGVLDRRGKDRAWQQEQLGQVDAQYGRMRADRRAGLQDRLLESQVAENEADAAAKRRAPAVKDIEIGGGYIIRPNGSGGYDTVYSPPSKPPNLFDGAQDVVDENGNVIMVGRDGKPILNPATNQPFVRRRAEDKPPKVDTSQSQREALQANINEATSERDRIGSVLTNTPRTIPGPIQGQDVPNPDYVDLMRRYRQLDDDVRKWRADLGKVPTITARSGGNDAAIEQRLRAEAKAKGLDPDKAVSRYRSGKY